MALIAVMVVSTLSVSFLRVSSALSKRQSQALHIKRAFYLAEATALVSDQPQVGLVDERGGLKRLARLFLRELAGRQAAKFAVDRLQ